jgi:hypothetical protein
MSLDGIIVEWRRVDLVEVQCAACGAWSEREATVTTTAAGVSPTSLPRGWTARDGVVACLPCDGSLVVCEWCRDPRPLAEMLPAVLKGRRITACAECRANIDRAEAERRRAQARREPSDAPE